MLQHHNHPTEFGDLATVHEQLALAVGELQGCSWLIEDPGSVRSQPGNLFQGYPRVGAGGEHHLTCMGHQEHPGAIAILIAIQLPGQLAYVDT